MTATLTTLAAILKEFYLGPIQEQLNNEVLCLELFEKVTTDWAGKQVVIPIHVSRNTGVGFSKAGTLPAAGNQGYEQLVVTAENLYGRFEITGDAIAATRSSRGSFAGYVDAEMNKLVNDIRNTANVMCVSGGNSIGFIWEDSAATTTTPYNGQFEEANGAPFTVLPADTITLTSVSSTYDGALGGVAVPFQVSAISESSITFAAAQNTNALPAGDVLCVRIAAGVKAAVADEPVGMIGNLGEPTHFGVSRAGAGVNVSVRSNFRLVAAANQGAGVAASGALSLDDLQKMLDDIEVASHKTPNLWLMHPAMRVTYTSLLQGQNDGNIRVRSDSAGHGDGGFSTLGYSNIPMKTSRAAPKGLIFACHTKSWKLCELQKGGFADLDGSTLSRVSGQDAFEGYYRWYYNTVCTEPSANGVIVGVTF